MTTEQYFMENRIEKFQENGNKIQTEVVILYALLLECVFSFNQKFRNYFSVITGVSLFKFNVDMATAWRKVKAENDLNSTIQDNESILWRIRLC